MSSIPQYACSKCGIEKPLSEFRKKTKSRHGYSRSCRVCDAARDREYVRTHIQDMRAKSRQWRKDNPGRHVEYQREYRKTYVRDPEYNREWKRKNRDAVVRHAHDRRARLYKSGGRYTKAEWIALCVRYDNRCAKCGEQKPLTVDHVIPVSKGGANTIDNLQPLCTSCNCHKWTKIIDYRRE